MESFEALVRRLEELFAKLEELDDPTREHVIELLDGIDTLHRFPLRRMAEILGPETIAMLKEADPAVAWLLDAYELGEPVDRPGAVPVQITPRRTG